MVYFKKSQPAPECLAVEKSKKSGDYKCGDVIDRLKADFKNKCYICEDKAPTSINIEHFMPHRSNNIDLKFSWNNLFFACSHCNKIKRTHENLLNCTNKDENPEYKLKHIYEQFPKAHVSIEILDNSIKSKETKKLLLKIYNGTTKLGDIEAENICKKLIKEIDDFLAVLSDYLDNTLDNKDREKIISKIKGQLSNASAFTAFKRWIVREDEYLCEEFKKYLTDI